MRLIKSECTETIYLHRSTRVQPHRRTRFFTSFRPCLEYLLPASPCTADRSIPFILIIFVVQQRKGPIFVFHLPSLIFVNFVSVFTIFFFSDTLICKHLLKLKSIYIVLYSKLVFILGVYILGVFVSNC